MKKEEGKIRRRLCEWWARGADIQNKIGQWTTHVFREHHEEADGWAEKGMKGEENYKKRKRVECRERAMWFLGWHVS